MNVHKTGMTVGVFAGLVHLVWGILISLGLAQVYLDFVMNMHSLNNPYKVLPFNLGQVVMLVILASILGYIIGSVFATIFNKLHK